MREASKILGASRLLAVQAADNGRLLVTEAANVEPGSKLDPGFHAFSSQVAAAHGQAIRGASYQQLDDAVRSMWAAFGDGSVTEADAEHLQSISDRRRPARNGERHPNITPIGQRSDRLVSRFKTRQRQCSPDKQKSRERTRKLAMSGALPPNARASYPLGQAAVLAVITIEIRGNGNGACDFPVDKIAAMAGVGRTTAQSAIHEARRLGHITVHERPRPGRKNLTNIIKLAAPEWKKWAQRGSFSKGTIGSNFVKNSSPTKTRVIKEENWSNHQEFAIFDHDSKIPPVITASLSALGIDAAWSVLLRDPGSD